MNTLTNPLIIAIGEVDKFKASCEEFQIYTFINNFDEQLAELYEVENPMKSHDYSDEDVVDFTLKYFQKPADEIGNWIIYPWSHTAVRLLDEKEFIRLRTSRNRYIITEAEQLEYFNSVIGVAGLSVGSSIATALVLTGGCKHIKISDRDTLAPTNLNRIAVGVNNLGVNKSVITARRIYEMNPYAEVELFKEGINEENIEEFMVGKKPLTLLFEEIDNIKIKYDLRIKARELEIPVVMITDNGDNVMVDIERFDQGEKRLFYGLIDEDEAREIFSQKVVDTPTRMKMALKIIGIEVGVPRMQQSLLEAGKTIPSWPQLGTATTLTGAVGAYIARRIINKLPLKSGRMHISLDSALIPEYESAEQLKERADQTAKFAKALGGM